ncbi:TPA: hypothetical protein QDA83_000256 [Burkholderia multivorans]|nr:hypothetical protein [Burkholderia multivorans]MBU9297239.1 hypothetical protein [Burkholderia multivorans]MBU9301263.1 hypothetical protein [Burkholderia multivorans]MBU9404264.1 hypothetical protein [Burkholderia multivorans]MBU9452487.1 hypothetical protein [Burkholderia multivorans]MBU9499352.1 hypothetical protein [Burkholderia multivorans]
MSTDTLTKPNEVWCATSDLALRIHALIADWQHEWHALTGRRIERDRDAIRRLQQALAEVQNWPAFGEIVQRAMRDYAIASVAIWQDAAELGLRRQYESAGVWRAWAREYGAGVMPREQIDWLPDLSRLALVDGASMPWHDWMTALEHRIAGDIDGSGSPDGAAVRAHGKEAAREVEPLR